MKQPLHQGGVKGIFLGIVDGNHDPVVCDILRHQIIIASSMHINDLNHTIDTWLKELDHYDLTQLLIKPSEESWSLGQVYMHLLENARYYIEEINACISSDLNSYKEASPEAKTMFHNNAFPDILIEGPPENASTLQPESKEQLFRQLSQVKDEINRLAEAIGSTSFKGKTKHPGLNYFGAEEWIQFADMHFRHHLRQKQRLDEFLRQRG